MSIKELARKAQIGENSIYRWKTIKPSTQSLTKVARQLHVSTDYLLGQEESSNKKTA
ncbi:helix-turn-helix transcriptional regulator [Lactobacillus sp. R2/2]|nr:helix-turn-helix transcriptional regulator [Lactobacillus sp. R2/2]